MNKRQSILNELTALNSSLGTLPVATPYRVPEGYFEALSEAIRLRISESQPVKAGLPDYSVPAGYFEDFAANLMKKISSTETNDADPVLSSTLASLRNKNPYTVPEGYFEHLQPRKTRNAPVFAISRKVFRMAAAAVIVGLIALSGILYFTRDIIDPVEEPAQWMARQVKKVPSENLEEFVEMTAPSEEPVAASASSPEIKQLLGAVSSESLEDFIEDVSVITDDDDLYLN